MDKEKDEILICHGFNCGTKYAELISRKLAQKYEDSDVEIDLCGCLGNCHNGNNLMVNDKMLEAQTPENVVKNVDRVLSRQQRARSGPISTEQAEDILGI